VASGEMTLSVRVIDGTYGRPAAGVAARLVSDVGSIQTERLRQRTDHEGRVAAQLAAPVARGLCRFEFDINGYFATLGITSFYSEISISFRLSNSVSVHEITVVITPSTYAVFKEG
jgi:5-hydroxyisourate hydrolase